MSRMIRFLRTAEVSYDLEHKITSWVNFDFGVSQDDSELMAVRESLPVTLKRQFEAHMLQ